MESAQAPFFHQNGPLSSAEVPAGYPHQNKINEKIERAPGTIPTLPIVPRALSFSFSPASPQHKEASAEERGVNGEKVLCLPPLLWYK